MATPTASPSSLTLLLCDQSSMAASGKKSGEIFPSEEAVAEALAEYVAELSARFLKDKQFFTVVLSGGTLIHTLRKLLESPYRDEVKWSRWKIFWVDERVVSLKSQDSNYKLAFDEFLSKVPISQSNIYPMMPRDGSIPTPEEAADRYNGILKELVDSKILPLSATGYPKFDLMLLGTGPSGTVGSLFPNRPQPNTDKPWVTFLDDAPEKPPGRVTLVFPVIDSASEIALVVTGIKFALVVYVVMGGHRPPGLRKLPVERIQSKQRSVTRFLDQDAAAFLLPK
ncbi:unnamed protein product [Ilex paraguariensis]|uniref:Probable 6-phosphogluconolactonase n=1 Tax=Ilex paraguariensis TaxID=185542 RepID=A0ABC8RND5_9AQUA